MPKAATRSEDVEITAFMPAIFKRCQDIQSHGTTSFHNSTNDIVVHVKSCAHGHGNTAEAIAMDRWADATPLASSNPYHFSSDCCSIVSACQRLA